jgi:hypothetical protein
MTLMIILKGWWNLGNTYLSITSDFLCLPVNFIIVLLISIYGNILLAAVMFKWA